MKDVQALIDCRGLFSTTTNIVKLLDNINQYKSKSTKMVFKEEDKPYDTLEMESINHQHVFYDFLDGMLVFGNRVKVKVEDIVKLEHYVSGQVKVFTIYYLEDKAVKSVSIGTNFK